MSDQQSPSQGEFKTFYEGGRSKFFPEILIVGEQPRAHNNDETSELKKWKKKIRKDAAKKLDPAWSIVPNQRGGECHLYMVFKLLDEYRPVVRDGEEVLHNRYREIDVDNLLKAALDAIKDKNDEGAKRKKPLGLITDDAFIRGIKVYKEPVYTTGDEGLLFQCITTKTFTIKKVEIIKGDVLMPNYWRHDVQCITAIDEEGKEGKFIDNLKNHVFMASTDNDGKPYPDSVPGYDWEGLTKLEPPQKATGCMVFKRTHSDGKGNKKTFHWLHKWAWW